MSSIFLSHSSKDNAIAAQVKARLEEWGHRSVFLDFDPEQGIPAGRDWEKELYAKLRECRAVIVLCSQASMASRWCFAEMAHAKALGKEVFPIKIDDAQVDPILTSKQIINVTAGWDEAYQRLEKGLLAAGLDPKDPFDWDGTRPPYPGLMVFEEQDAAIFFGRDKEIREGQALLNRLQQLEGHRLTLMLGASGSGKSSLMRAGLLPRFKRDRRWVVVEPFRPLETPFDQLVKVLSHRFSQISQAGVGTPNDVVSIVDRIRREEHVTTQSVEAFLGLTRKLCEKPSSQEMTVLLMIDQCEELLAVGTSQEKNQFLDFLRAVLNCADSHLMVLGTLDSEFLGSFQDHKAMRGLRFETFPVPKMEVDDFAAVIEGPAKIAGLELGPGLVRAMINDTKTSDALPLLAFTLRELYEGFGQSKQLMLEDYRDKLGRLDGCIARAAETVLNATPLSKKEVIDLRTVFLRMVRVKNRGQYATHPIHWNDLPHSIHEMLERFVKARLFISSRDKTERTLEVAHESLFRAWPQLATWLNENQLFLDWRDRLKERVMEWLRHQKDEGSLLRGGPLGEAQDWFSRESVVLTDVEKEYIERSTETHERAKEVEQQRTEREMDQLKRLTEEAVKREEAERARAEAAEQAQKAAEDARKAQQARAQEAEATKHQQTSFFLVVLILILAVVIASTAVIWLFQHGYTTVEQVRLRIQSVFGSSIHRPPSEEKMKLIPGGSFQMGDVEKQGGEFRAPSHLVTIKPFKLGKYEVTFEEYDRFAISTGRRLPSDQGWGRGSRPVIDISWNDAKEYVGWLSKQTKTWGTKKAYRLPTESEWEYAARSGQKQERWSGTSEESELGRYAWFIENSNGRTAEVDKSEKEEKHEKNEFNIYDLSGNVWEWVQDCVHRTYDGAPTDGSAWEQEDGKCEVRMIRGGSWFNDPEHLRTSDRGRLDASSRTNGIGFRLAQDIEP